MAKPKIFKNRTEMVASLPPGLVIAEIGVFEGQFSKTLYETKPTKLFLVDLYGGRMGSGDEDGGNFKFVDLTEVYDHLKDLYPIDIVNVVRASSEEFLSSKPDDFFDVVYIDADHSYEAVKRDLELSLAKTKTGGSIMGHDYSAIQFPGVFQAVNEFCKCNGLAISEVTDNRLPSYRILVK